MSEPLTVVRRECEELLHRIDPTLADGPPLYIVSRDDAPEAILSFAEGLGGMYSTALRRTCETPLREAGRWRGDGPVILVTVRPDDYEHDHWFRSRFIGTALHEAAHVYDDEKAFVERKPFDVGEWEAANGTTAAEYLFSGIVSKTTDTPPSVTRSHHGLRWHRAALHLWFRAEQRGEPLSLVFDLHAGGPDYCDYSVFEILRALGNEPAERAGDPLREILATEPPEAFARLWGQDTGQN